jgi:hypothetical protein
VGHALEVVDKALGAGALLATTGGWLALFGNSLLGYGLFSGG